MSYVLSTICLHANPEAHVACNFDCFAAENEVLFKVTASHVHCISKAVPDEVIDATEYKSPIESDT